MDDVTILHLSDLHINNEYSNTWEYFFVDLKKEIKLIEDKKIVVVVTGDIIHQGVCFSDDANPYQNALEFFRSLKKILGNKFAGIYFVPGNHDKSRTKRESFFVPQYRNFSTSYKASKSVFDNDFYNSIWPIHLEAYGKEKGTGYLDLVKEIYQIFEVPESEMDNKSYIKDTFGVDMIEISGKKYCFILMNTAWSCVNDEDDRNLVFGKFQLEKIKKEYKAIFSKGNKPDVTIAIGHHPVESFMGKERDYIFNELISIDGFNANMYLCGHMHDEIVNNWINNRHSMNTFVTGFGWPDSGGQHVAKHTYAMYAIDQEANSVNVYMKKSSDRGTYIPNFSIYTQDTSEVIGNKLSFPLFAHKTLTYIDVKRGFDRSSESHYLSRELLLDMKSYAKMMNRFSYLNAMGFDNIKWDIYEEIVNCLEAAEEESELDENDSTEDGQVNELDEELYNYLFFTMLEYGDISDNIYHLFSLNEGCLFNKFWEYLGNICQCFVESIENCMGEECGIVRTHFRYYHKSTNEFEGLNISVSGSRESKDYILTPIKYGQLIEAAHKKQVGLVYSANRELLTDKLNERWTNFITIVPDFKGNEYSFYPPKGKRVKVHYPLITFGVSVNSKRMNNLLYLMDFFSIKDLLEELIENFLHYFPIDMERFCEWAATNVKGNM